MRKGTIGILGLLAVLAGGTFAYSAIVPTTINACVARNGNVRILDSGETKCKKNERALSWNNVGPKGDTGAAGTSSSNVDARISALEARIVALEKKVGTSTPPGPILTDGIVAEVVSIDASAIKEDDNDDTGDYEIKFDITAFGRDHYLSKSVAEYLYDVLDSEGNKVMASTTASISNRSGADSSGNTWIIRKGETETFDLVVFYNPDSAGNYSIQFKSFNYGTSTQNVSANKHALTPLEDFRTDSVFLRN